MISLYRDFITEGDLAFDIGAHLGNRISAFLALGARVVAVEPHPTLAMILRVLYGWRGVRVVSKAVAEKAGDLPLQINSKNLTVSSASADFVRAAADAEGWRDQVWDRTATVGATTIDELIVLYGEPCFIKIDVEGFELNALHGLSRHVKALSFEFTTMQRELAIGCIDRCVRLGFSEFNVSIGETQRLFGWRKAQEMANLVRTLPADLNSGDIYAR
jgi:FkbM family methyltransferase